MLCLFLDISVLFHSLSHIATVYHWSYKLLIILALYIINYSGAGSRCLLTMKATLKVRRKSAPCIRFVLQKKHEMFQHISGRVSCLSRSFTSQPGWTFICHILGRKGIFIPESILLDKNTFVQKFGVSNMNCFWKKSRAITWPNYVEKYIRTENSYNITVLSVQKFLAMRIINQN